MSGGRVSRPPAACHAVACHAVAARASAILRAVGAWRSLVAHLNGVQEVERSNRSAPTIA